MSQPIHKDLMHKEPIYKVSHLDNNLVKTIYVFIGKMTMEAKYKDLDKVFRKNPLKSIFSGIFSAEELTEITDNNITVKFIPDRLHLDDTIESIWFGPAGEYNWEDIYIDSWTKINVTYSNGLLIH